MEFETLYEISRTPFPGLAIFSIFWVVLSLTGIIIYLRRSSKEKNEKGRNINVLIFGICLVIGFFLFSTSIETGGSEDVLYAENYYNGNYEIIEGEIEDYSSAKGASYFTVQDKYFSVYNFIFPSIPESGYVKVYYVELDDYYKAVRVEIKIEES